MKVIDLLNKIANGEIKEDTMFEYSYGSRYTARQFFNSYIVDKENLNDEIEIIEEDKKIEKLYFSVYEMERVNREVLEKIEKKFNEIIDKIQE